MLLKHGYCSCRPSSWMPNYAAQNVYSQQQVQTNGAQPSTSTNYASAYTPTYPQPQYSHHSPHTSQMDPLFGQQSGHGTPTYPQTQPQGQLQTGVPDILSQLVSAGLIPAGKQRGAIGAKAGPQAAPVVPPLVFNLSKSKVGKPSAEMSCPSLTHQFGKSLL